jgi:hypothetical protein
MSIAGLKEMNKIELNSFDAPAQLFDYMNKSVFQPMIIFSKISYFGLVNLLLLFHYLNDQ